MEIADRGEHVITRAFTSQIAELLQKNGIIPICSERYINLNPDVPNYSSVRRDAVSFDSLIAPSMTERLENRHTEILSKNLRAELIRKIYLKNSLKLNVYYWSVIRMGLIDADTLKKDLKSVALSNGTLVNTNTVLLLLDKYPTAYDVDKVVKQLEEIKHCTNLYDDETKAWISAIDEAIDIVKRGGNIELSEHSESQGNRTGK